MSVGGSAAAYAELRSKHNRLIEVLGVTVNYKDELTDKINDLKEALKTATAERDAAREQNDTTSETISQKDARILFLENHANENLQEIQNLRSKLSSRASSSSAGIQTIGKSVTRLKKDLALLREEVVEATSNRAAQINEVCTRMGVISKARSRGRQDKSDKQSQEALAAATKQAKDKIESLESALAAEKMQSSELRANLDKSRKRIRQLEFDFSEQADGFAAKLSFTKMENSELLSQLARTRTALKTAEENIADLQEQLKNANSSTSSASAFKQFLDVKAQNQKLQDQVKRLKARLKR
mgnify:CR=1 FL=1